MEFDDIKLELRGQRSDSDNLESGNSFTCTFTQSCTCSTCSRGNCTLTGWSAGC